MASHLMANLAAVAACVALAACGGRDPEPATASAEVARYASGAPITVKVADFLMDVTPSEARRIMGSNGGRRTLDLPSADYLAVAKALAPDAKAIEVTSGAATVPSGQAATVASRAPDPTRRIDATTLALQPILQPDGTIRLSAVADQQAIEPGGRLSATRHLDREVILQPGKTEAIAMPSLDAALRGWQAERLHVTAFSASMPSQQRPLAAAAATPADEEPTAKPTAPPRSARPAARPQATEARATATDPAPAGRRDAAAPAQTATPSPTQRARDLFD